MTPEWLILVTLLGFLHTAFGFALCLLSPHLSRWLQQRLAKKPTTATPVTPAP